MVLRKNTYDLQHHNTEEDKSKKSSKIYKGLFLALLTGICYSLSAVIVKQMKNLHPGQLAVYRFLAVFAFSFPQAVKCGENLLGPKNLRFLLLLRGIFGATNLFLNYIAFRYLPLGESILITYSDPVFVTVAARILLKEPCGIFQSLTCLTTIVGIVFITQIPQKLAGNSVVYTTESIYGLISAIGSLFFSTLRFIVIRKLNSVHHSVITFNFGWVGILETFILTCIVGNFQLHKCGLQSLYIILLGIVCYAAPTLQTMALQCELAGPVSTMTSASNIVLAFVWQTLLFHEVPNIYSLVGAVLILVSVIFIGFNKWVSSLHKESPYRKKLNWMLK